MNLPHEYTASASSSTAGAVALRAEGMEDILSNAPANFGGPGDLWSPEDLQVAAIASCFVLSFRAIAAASRLDWESLDVSVTGTLDKVEHGMAFTGFSTRAELVLPAGASRDKAQRLLEKAEQNCLITNSLSAPNHLGTAVTGGE
jgi:organic hydroperoxide reductase OsmC/OhrA